MQTLTFLHIHFSSVQEKFVANLEEKKIELHAWS